MSLFLGNQRFGAQVFPVWLPNLQVSAGTSFCKAEMQKDQTDVDIGEKKKPNLHTPSVFLGV